jgi:hypothetical protein
MSTVNVLLMMLGAAVCSSVLTLVVLLLVARLWGGRYLDGLMSEAKEQFSTGLRGTVEEAAEAVMPRLREQVRQGFAAGGDDALPRFRAELDAAAEEVLPRFREQVRGGFKDALADAMTGGVLERAGEELARKGESILETGVNILLGRDEEEK